MADEQRYVNVYDPTCARIVRSHFGPVQPDLPYTFDGKAITITTKVSQNLSKGRHIIYGLGVGEFYLPPP